MMLHLFNLKYFPVLVAVISTLVTRRPYVEFQMYMESRSSLAFTDGHVNSMISRNETAILVGAHSIPFRRSQKLYGDQGHVQSIHHSNILQYK